MLPSGDRNTSAQVKDIRIRGARLLLRALRPDEIDGEWLTMVTADLMMIGKLPDEASFKARLGQSGQFRDGELDLAIDLDGESIGRIQTYVAPNRSDTFEVIEMGIMLRENARGKGYGREALATLTDWLFEHVEVVRIEARADPANTAMLAIFHRLGWELVGTFKSGREWLLYSLTRAQWCGRQ